MPSVLKGRRPGLVFGATFAVGFLLLVGAVLVMALVASLSGAVNEEQRASQAEYTAFGGYHEDCDVVDSRMPTGALFWCGYVLMPDQCHLVVGSSSGTRYYSCYRPPEGSIEGGETGPGLWACVVDDGRDTGMRRVAMHSGRRDDQEPCGQRFG